MVLNESNKVTILLRKIIELHGEYLKHSWLRAEPNKQQLNFNDT
jgi:hypothetical protein